MPDPSSTFTEPTTESTPVNLRPILKKSSEDLTAPTPLLPNSTISILKNKDDLFGVNKAKRRSTGEDGKGEHVRIRSPSPLNRSEHVRIRTPSPDSESSGREDAPLPILRRSRDNSLGAEISDSEIPSILKRRVSSEDLGLEDYAHSPEKTSSILKRKSSFGSSTYSGIQSPEAGIHEVTRGILKKSSRNSSRTCSRSASIEDLDVEGTKSILKSRNSSRTCSRSGSQDELDLDLEDEEEEWMEPKPKSILKKKQGSTDDELDDRPKSILKSRRSEESLSPSLKSRRSEGSLSPDTDYQFSRSGRNYTRHSSLPSDPEDVRSGRSSPLVKFPDFDSSIRPILKNRDDSKPAGILKRREKSSSPISATKLRRGANAASPTYTASKSYSPSHHFYPVETPPSPEQIPPPWRQVSPLEADSGGGGFGLERQQPSPPPLLRPRTSTPPQLPCSSPPLSRPQGRQSSPPYTNDQRSTRGATAAAGGRPGSPIQRSGLRIMSPQQRRSNSPPLPPITPGLVSQQQRSNNGGSSWRPQGHVNWMAGTGHVQRGDIKLHTDSQDMEEEILQIVEQRDLLEDSDDIKLSLVQRLPNMENNQSAGPTIGRPPKSGGSGNIAGSAFISTSGSINNIVSHQPPSQGSGNSSRRRRKNSNSRFQTQPITVDEVEKARRGFMDPSSGNSPIPGIRSSPLYSMLRPLSLEELGGDSKCSGVSISLSSTRTNASSTSSILPSETLSSSSNKSAATNQYTATSLNQFKWAESEMLQPQPQLHSFRQSSQSSCDSSSSPKGGSNLDYEGAAADNLSSNQTTSKSFHVSQFSSPKSATAAVFRPVRSPPPLPSSLPPSAQFSRHFSSPPPLQRNSSRNAGRQRERSLLQQSRRSLSSPAVDKGASNPSPPPLFSFNSQHQESSGHFQATTSSSFSRKLLSSPPPSSSSPHQYHQYSPSGDQSLQYSPSRQQAQLLSTAGSPPPLSSSSPVMLMRPSSLGVSMASPTRTSSPPLAQPLARPSAFKPVPTRVQSIPGGGELTPVTGPIPLYRESSQEKAFSSGDELIPGILKNREHMGPEMRGISSLSKVPRKSILKNDFGAINMTSSSVSTAVSDDTLQMSSSMRNSNVSHPPPPARGVLKKDFSYDGRVGVSVASKGGRGGDSGSSGSSSEDVGRTFSDVVIDPIPGQGRRSAPETPIKRGAGTRTPVIPPSSVKISADGDLAGKLAKLSTQADNIKHKMNSEERADYDPADINTNNRLRRRASSNSNKLSFY